MERHRSSTRKIYYSVWRTFNEFYIKLDQKPKTWEDRLILFIGFLVETKKKASTIRSYISAIKAVLEEDNYDLNPNKYLISSLTKTCSYKNCQVRTRLSISKKLLELILEQTTQHLEIDSNQVYLSILYKALFSAAYYGLLRVAELTTGSHPIMAKDVQLADNKRKILFILRMSKTHWKDKKPQYIKISMVSNSSTNPLWSGKRFCPYDLINQYLKVRGGRRPNCVTEPFFIFQDKTPVTPSHMRKTLHLMLSQIGLEPENYGTHSFRIGHCVDLLKLSVSIKCIKFLGRWWSNAVFEYLKNC